jgi:VanZ family protein
MLRFQHLTKFAAWSAAFTVAILSLLPGTLRPESGMPGKMEHMAAYFITAILFTMGYRAMVSPVAIVGLLSGYAAALEVAQLWIPKRFAALSDWLAGSFGAVVGVALAMAWVRVLARPRP